MPEKKAYPLRIPPDLWEAIRRLADDELRSVNAQMELLLREGLKRRGRDIKEKSDQTDSE